ncbi:hypothetical protein M9H77_27061 [Catharanthus roseus]|uniref:Uncharacterized protein n=1 Tax=Catharanthus roseus TaxID=4058 RepID=A0ACC0AFP7_CATRO|nr:hypothetical protein M9H77_27061 [Catharanthus roseus]
MSTTSYLKHSLFLFGIHEDDLFNDILSDLSNHHHHHHHPPGKLNSLCDQVNDQQYVIATKFVITADSNQVIPLSLGLSLSPYSLNSATPPPHLPSLSVIEMSESETFINGPPIQLDLHQPTTVVATALGRRISHPRTASCYVKPQL